MQQTMFIDHILIDIETGHFVPQDFVPIKPRTIFACYLGDVSLMEKARRFQHVVDLNPADRSTFARVHGVETSLPTRKI